MCVKPISYFSRAAEGTWRGGSEPVAGLILPGLFMSQWAEIPLAKVLFQLAQALSR